MILMHLLYSMKTSLKRQHQSGKFYFGRFLLNFKLQQVRIKFAFFNTHIIQSGFFHPSSDQHLFHTSAINDANFVACLAICHMRSLFFEPRLDQDTS